MDGGPPPPRVAISREAGNPVFLGAGEHSKGSVYWMARFRRGATNWCAWLWSASP